MQRTEYQKVFAISQSAIKAFRTKSIQEFREIYITKDKADEGDDDKFAFGSLVDTLAFTPNLLDERFYIPNNYTDAPGEKVKYIVDRVYRKASEIVENKRILNEKGNLPEPMYIPLLVSIDEWTELILEVAKEIEYGGKTWSKSRIIDTVYADGNQYFAMLSEANGRTLITSSDNADAVDMVEALRTNKDTQRYFVQQEGETLLFQQEIFVDHVFNDGLIVPLKAALDIIRLDHVNKTIEVPDLKTTHNSETFRKIARDFDYITQLSFYLHIVQEWLKEYNGGIYKDYTPLAPINIVIDRRYKIPYIYEYDWDDMEIARKGSVSNYAEGWENTLNRIAWHIKMGIWDRPKELYETGRIKLKIYNHDQKSN